MRAGRRGPADILLVEDDSGDVLLLKEAFKACRERHHFSVVEDGEQALAFLRRQGRYTDAPTPDLVLLDLNMPRKDGREVIGEIKQADDLRRIPVVVLTTSDSEVDVRTAYQLHANCYIVKPMGLEDYVEIAKRIENFWLDLVRLPQG